MKRLKITFVLPIVAVVLTAILTACSSNNPQSLFISKSGSGAGTVQSAPAGIDCGSDCAGSFPQDSLVMLTATPDAGSSFSAWSGGCVSTAGDTCVVKMSGGKTIIATFAAASSVTVAVTKSGAGSGIVMTSDGKLFCGTVCSGDYSPGASVSLQAFAATGSTFSSWGGVCSGTSGGSCTVTPTADIGVDATFDVVSGPALGPTQSDCDAVSVGSECDVTVTLVNGTGFRGLEFGVSSASFGLVSVGSVPAGCFASAGVKVVIACNSTVPGGGNVAVLRMMRSGAAAAVVMVENAFVAGDATSKDAVEGGALGVSASSP